MGLGKAVRRMEDPMPGEAAERLAKYEAVLAELIADQADVARRLERLRDEGLSKTVRFRELMGRKLTNQYLLVLLKKHGIEPSGLPARKTDPTERDA
jgi:hypothetical protein